MSKISKPSVLLVCYAGTHIGLGHFSRLLALAQALKKTDRVQVEFLVFGDPIKKAGLNNFKTHFIPASTDFLTGVTRFVTEATTCVVFDLFAQDQINNLGLLFIWLKTRDISIINVDSLTHYNHLLDLIWIPSFYFKENQALDYPDKIKYGWDCYLIQKKLVTPNWKPGTDVLVLTGGSDITHLGQMLPQKIDNSLKAGTHIHWVRGPFAKPPDLPKQPRLKWSVYNSPDRIDEYIVKSNYVLTVFGVSFFEVLQYGIPTVVFSPYEHQTPEEMLALAKENVAMVSKNDNTALNDLIELMNNNDIALTYSENALKKLSINGSQRLSEVVCSLASV
jgi:spore coat polysaccharide biosynthesis predicted glycosyltransferase SpsG